jgi:choline-sulfatase
MPRKPNFVLVITDQQSGNPYWPDGWAEENLPALGWLKEHGIEFERAYTNSCTCSPSRTTLFTGLFPAQHGVTEVLEFDNIQPMASDVFGGGNVTQAVAMNVKERRQRGLSHNLQNLAKILKTAGYNVIFKGKWHLTRPVNWVKDDDLGIDQRYWTEADVQQIAEMYGFDGWTYPDAGDNLAVANMGGGAIENDQRFLTGHGQAAKYGDVPFGELEPHSAIHFLKTYDEDEPFCLIVSLVNPHDVLAYPGTNAGQTGDDRTYRRAGYQDEWFFDLPIDRPPTWDEDLATKPKAQTQFLALSNGGNGVISKDDPELQKHYCQFYAYLCRHVDRQILEVLKALEGSKHADETYVVRISDHGDMAMAHGLQRQKMFNVYEETLNVPFVLSHPHEVDRGKTTDSLVGLIDLLPTIANLAGVPEIDRWTFKGRDLSPILTDAGAEVQDYVHFTYEDHYFFVPASGSIRSIVEKRWKYAVYYDLYTDQPFEYEMYDLAVPRDEREVVNLGHPGTEVTPEVRAERERLHRKLSRVMELLGTRPDGVEWPAHWGEQR